MAASGSERVAVGLCKGINGLDKVVLRDPRGSTAEVLFTIKTPTFDDFFFWSDLKLLKKKFMLKDLIQDWILLIFCIIIRNALGFRIILKLKQKVLSLGCLFLLTF